jgi:Flp pilus assembly pilin Flp
MSLPQAAIVAEDRGSVAVEYVVLLIVVALGVALVMTTLGAPLIRMFRSLEIWVGLPFP